jgi:imidazolonepropionase-like amidohydrolase
MRVLGMALHGSLALAVLSSPMDFMKDQISRGQWIKVSDGNSSGVVNLVIDKTHTHSLTDRVSNLPNSQQLRQEPLKRSSIRAASASQYVATVNYNYAGCKTFYEAFIETADECIYSADNSYSYLLTLNSTHYTRAYYTDKFCESTSYKSTTRKLVSTCASYALGMIYASSTQLLAVEQQYVLLR